MKHLKNMIIKIFSVLGGDFMLTPKQVYWYVNAYKKRYTLKEVYEMMKKLNGKYIEKVGDKRKTHTATYKSTIKRFNKIKDYY